MAKILLAEDDQDLSSVVRRYLIFEHHRVECVTDGEEALCRLRVSDYDLLILDWDLPGRSGIDVISEVRGAGKVNPILIITGKSSAREKTIGLDTGADDYLTKPFVLEELGARVRALLRRKQEYSGIPTNMLVHAIVMDTARHRVKKGGQPVDLLPKEFQLMEFLMSNTNRVFTPETLLAAVWPSDSSATTEALRSTIKRLRKKLDPEGRIIKTVHGVGYILENED